MRPAYGNAFEFDRILYPYFYTSNVDKLVQARLIFSRFGFRLRHYRSEREPYDEDYSLDTRNLLEHAVKQVSDTFRVRSIYFVEDTSLHINALSGGFSYPGMRVKEWFNSITFAELNEQIQLKGGDRGAVVRSDIALKLPNLDRPIFFHGETIGSIALSPPNFEASIQYPWLTPNTFNGWFIPQGATKRLGEMEFEESLEHDFRAKSLIALVSRLEELSASINLIRANYFVRQSDVTPAQQFRLIPFTSSPIYIVVGHKCAGKTTFADCVAEADDVLTLEGSTILREHAARSAIEINSSSDAIGYLEREGFDVVAREVATIIQREEARTYVISGLRTVEEVHHLLQSFPSARLVWIEAGIQERYERHIKRARDTDVKTLLEFRQQDESQMKFGLLRAGSEIADVIIRNEDSMEVFRERIRDFVDRSVAAKDRRGARSEFHRTLLALRDIKAAATCEEISSATISYGARVRKYNTNRALKAAPEFARRYDPTNRALLRYRILDRGLKLVEILERKPPEQL